MEILILVDNCLQVMPISNRCKRGLMPNLIKKSETVSINAVVVFSPLHTFYMQLSTYCD